MGRKNKITLIASALNGDLASTIANYYNHHDGFTLKDVDGVFKNTFVVILMANMDVVVVKKFNGNGKSAIDKIPTKVFLKHFKPLN